MSINLSINYARDCTNLRKLMLLRPIQPPDRDAWHRLVARNRAGLGQYFPETVARNETPRKTALAMRHYRRLAELHSMYLWVIDKVVADELSGAIFLKDIDSLHLRSELAYFTDAAQAGKGLMTRALSELCEYAFTTMRLHKLVIKVTPANVASQKVAENCGFEKEGILKQDYRMNDGSWSDVIVYGKLTTLPPR